MSIVQVTTAVQEYLSAWGETNQEARRTILANCFSEDGSYKDPLVQANSRRSLDHLIAHTHNLFPGAKLVLNGEVQHHEHGTLFHWDMVGEGGALMLQGVDFAEIAGDGKVHRVVGFFPTAGLDAYAAFDESTPGV